MCQEHVCEYEYDHRTYRMDWRDIDEEFLQPKIVKAGIPPIPKHYGSTCPKNLDTCIKSFKLPNTTMTNWLCASDFPN